MTFELFYNFCTATREVSNFYEELKVQYLSKAISPLNRIYYIV